MADLLGTVKECVAQRGVKMRAALSADLQHALLMRHRGLIGTDIAKRIIYITNGNNLGGKRNLVALEPVGIALAIPALVMGERDIDCHLKNAAFG